ncbi:MAG: PilZ domain-containing protein [Bdellovibrionales bacterium]|nr:PilZ domain-containing protein [Bdellovibrionales bacterium]
MVSKKFQGQDERRKSPRRTLLQTFGFFAILPEKGMHRLPVHDLSESGIGMDIDIEGEQPGDFPAAGASLTVHLYLNQSLYLPLSAKVAWIRPGKAGRMAGVEFDKGSSGARKAVAELIRLLDVLHDHAELSSPSGS